MKKVIAVLMGIVMTAGLAACGSSGRAGTTAAETTEEETETLAEETTQAQTEETQASQDAENGSQADETAAASGTETDGGGTHGKTLVVYFSATGNTERVAEAIAAATGGELFELEPVDPYTDEDLNYNDENSRVSQEHADESLRNVELVADTVNDWQDVETVYIGYPVWWGIAAWPVNTFVEANDFTGKTVIPFCTSVSSGLGDSGQLLADLAGTGDWQEGMRFRSGADEADLDFISLYRYNEGG